MLFRSRGQMQVLDNRVAARRKMHDFYVDYFKNFDGVDVFSEPSTDYFSNHWLSAIVVNPDKLNGKTREDLRLFLEKSNIEARPLWKPLHMQPIFEKYAFYGTNICEKLFENGLCLPSGSNLTETDKLRISATLDNFFV